MNKKLYRKAIGAWGTDVQLDVAIEELSELTKEICKAKRGIENIDHLAEEVADVEIMCEQLRFIFNIDFAVDAWKKAKLMRLEDRLK